MSDDFVAHSGIDWQGHVGTVQYGGGDRNMVVLFFNKPIQNPRKSAENGRPFFEDVVYVRIHPPGERLNIVERPANPNDRKRWPVQWMQFQENRIQTPDGTPVDLLYPDQPAVSATLRANHVYTIEQLAELSADAIETIGMGAQHHVNAARKYLEAANKGVGASQLRRELEERDAQIRTLEHTIEMLKAQVDQMQKAQNSTVDLQQIQQLIAGMQGRPQFPAAPAVPPVFDAQNAQIAANGADARPVKRTRQRVR